MKRWLMITLIVLLIGLIFLLSSPILFIAEDETEGIPGADMAAIITFPGGFEWIYPGSSFGPNGHTLHNIHMEAGVDPYHWARDIITHTYGITPHIIIVINNDAAERIFGNDIVGDIREQDWGEGNPRGVAVENSINQFNIFGAIYSVFSGDIKFYLV